MVSSEYLQFVEANIACIFF